MSKQLITVTRGGLAFKYVPGTSFVSVWTDTAAPQSVPHDMIEMPPWINRSQVNEEALLAVIRWAYEEAK